MNKIKNCRICSSRLEPQSLVDLPQMPAAAQNLPSSKGQALASGTLLEVRECAVCGLVQLANEPVPYYREVIRAGSFSPSMISRQRDEFIRFIERFSLQGKNVIEIGSGRGEYLSVLSSLPINALGMEYNREFIEIANGRGLRAVQGYPPDLDNRPADLKFDAFISINFLEHAPAPVAFLRGCAALLAEGGLGMIAVPDFEFELQDNFLFSFVADHLCYFSADTLRTAAALSGFEVIDLFRNKSLNVVTGYLRKRRGCDLLSAKDRFGEFKTVVNDYIDSILKDGGRVAVWGASHLAFSVIAAAKTAHKIAYIVDSAHFKQGKYAPGSGLEIFPPRHLFEDPVDTVIIMAPEYSAEIAAGIRRDYAHVRRLATFINGSIAPID